MFALDHTQQMTTHFFIVYTKVLLRPMSCGKKKSSKLPDPFTLQLKILEDVIGKATYVIETTTTNLAKNGKETRTPADIELLKSTTSPSFGFPCLFYPIIIADYCNDDGKFLLEK